MTINATIYAHRNGNFRAGALGVEVISADPEHDLCHALVKAGVPDNHIRFIHEGGCTGVYHPSIHRMAKMRMGLGEGFPMRRVKRTEWKGPNAVKTGEPSITDGD